MHARAMMTLFSYVFGIELLVTQTNSESDEDIWQIIEPESLKSLP